MIYKCDSWGGLIICVWWWKDLDVYNCKLFVYKFVFGVFGLVFYGGFLMLFVIGEVIICFFFGIVDVYLNKWVDCVVGLV